MPRMRHSPRIRALALAGVFGLLQVGANDPMTAQTPPSRSEALLTTGLYGVRASFYPSDIPFPAIEGGGIAALGDQILLITGDGMLHLLSRRGDALTVRTARGRAPLDAESFRAAVPRDVQVAWFRVAGMLAQQLGTSGIRIFVSHHVWKADERCFVLRVSTVEGVLDALWQSERLDWQTLFETRPCLPIKAQGHPFAGHQSGGRLALVDDHTVLLTVGDHEFDGVNSAEDHPQSPSASYGKTVLIDLSTHAARVFTLGHRNPQGLLVRADGTIWVTEQGPRGGDELNRLVDGGNYGWPIVTYGVNYGADAWPRSGAQGRHEGYLPPVFAWIPSIGVSSLIEITGDRFRRWEGDLLVASLVAGTLFRVRVADDRALLVEPIEIGERIRDLAMAPDGSIVLWLDWRGVAFLDPVEEGHALDGQALFSAACGGCHAVGNGLAHGIGPDLSGLSTREIASARGYAYSSALSALDGTWTDARLDAFLRDPLVLVPGTTMRDVSVRDPAARSAIIGYLNALRQ